jgi:hypothetical protein
MPSLKEVAQYVRSKNAGPFWVTIDVFCADDISYARLTQAPLLSPGGIATVYGLNASDIKVFHDAPLRVIKISFPRKVIQGSLGDADSHAGQYFVALLDRDIHVVPDTVD